MCTVTLIARSQGYALGMNRDEKRSRHTARPPRVRPIAGVPCLFPSEPGGGTWIGVNASGVTFALVNWYSVAARVLEGNISRGEVVLASLPGRSSAATDSVFAGFDLGRVNPFRLIGVFPALREVCEWRWDLEKLERVRHPWATTSWVSSGFDEKGAQETRGAAFERATRQSTAGTVAWLRRLHRSHLPRRGPYSTCMHREDAATVSYTEIVVSRAAASMRYVQGPPCGAAPASLHRLPFDR